MRKLLLAFFAGSALLCGAAEPFAKAPIVRAALFKNGYALIVREVSAAPSDAFLIDETVRPVHGTLWFAPGDKLSVTGVKRIGTHPNRNPFADFSATYAGRRVTVTLRPSGAAQPRVLTGTVVQPGEQKDEIATHSSFFALRGVDGKLTVFPRGEIAAIESDGINADLPEQKRMLLVNRADTKGKPFMMSYLTSGLTWAPAYRIALGPDKLQLDESATVINELEDLKDVEVDLVSGFPNLAYLGVTSPLATGMTMGGFLAQLNGGRNTPVYARNFALAAGSFAAKAEMDSFSPLPETGLSQDIHFIPAGKITLAKGDVLYKTPTTATTGYERLVEWNIPDRRDRWGRVSRNSNDDPSGDLWDAVRFKNPLESPITTAPVEIIDGRKLLGQTTIQWVNPGEETTVRIAKAQTVTGTRTETEDSERSLTSFGSYNYRKSKVEGTLELHNFRKSAAKVTARLQYSGEFVSAEDSPKSRQLEVGVYSVNPCRELTWELTLKPGEKREVHYRYSVMIRN